MRLVILVMLTTVLAVPFAYAQKLAETISSDNRVDLRLAQNRYLPFCGLYCLYAVFRLHGETAPFDDLIDGVYWSGSKGSSLQQLREAAESNGFYALPLEKLTTSLLRHSKYPIILYVKRDSGSVDFDHYELYLGTESDKARMYDPPLPVHLEPFPELEERWSGIGLVISSEPIHKAAFFASSFIRLIPFAVCALLLAGVVHYIRRRNASVSGANCKSNQT